MIFELNASFHQRLRNIFYIFYFTIEIQYSPFMLKLLTNQSGYVSNCNLFVIPLKSDNRLFMHVGYSLWPPASDK